MPDHMRRALIGEGDRRIYSSCGRQMPRGVEQGMDRSLSTSAAVALSDEDSTSPADPRPTASRTLERIAAVALLIALFAATLALYTRHNDAPLWYHPDEDGKVQQLLERPTWLSGPAGRNFRHPQLLLEACQWWIAASGTPREPDAFARAGRNASAALGALAAVAFAVAGYMAFGIPGLLSCGAAVALCPSLLVYSHHLKEDSALAFGIGATVAATALFWRHPLGWIGWCIALPLLGISAALAASAKYAGAIALLIALPALAAPFRRAWQLPIRLVVFLVVFAAVFLVVNHRALNEWDLFSTRLQEEIDHAFTGHGGVAMDRPNGFIAYVAVQETQWHIKLLAVVFVIVLAMYMRRGGWRRNGWMLLAVWFTAASAAALSFGSIPFQRYALPVVVVLHFLAGLGAAAIVCLAARKRLHVHVGAGLALILFVAIQWKPCDELTAGFGDDSRQHLRQWLSDNVAPATRIVADHYALLRDPPDPRASIGQEPLQLRIGSPFQYRRPDVLASMARNGVRYVVVCDSSSERFLLPFCRPKPGDQQFFNRMKSFYQSVEQEGQLVWEHKPAYPISPFASPPLRVFRIERAQ